MSKEQELIKQAEKLALLPDLENSFQKLSELLGNETDHDMTGRVVAFFQIAVEENLFGKEHDKLFNQSKRLINTYPLPDDAEEQLQQIINQATDKMERFMLRNLGSALFVVREVAGGLKLIQDRPWTDDISEQI